MRTLGFASLLLLAGCFAGSFNSHAVEQRTHNALPASGVRTVRVSNVSGSIRVAGWDRQSVAIDTLMYGASREDLSRTHVEIARNGSEIAIRTRYDEGGSFFGSHNGAGVDYVVDVPANADVALEDVSGTILASGIGGNFNASAVSGRIEAALGTVSGSRSVRANTVSGSIRLQIARNSDAKLNAGTVSGGVHAFFPIDLGKNVVGSSAQGKIGNGRASLDLSTVSGSITVDPQ